MTSASIGPSGPTRVEARVLLLSAVVALVGYSVEGVTLAIVHQRPHGIKPLAAFPSGLVFAAGLFTFLAFADHLFRRGHGGTLGKGSRFSVRPLFTRGGWWRVFTPTYLRSAARVAGWNETIVIRILGTLVGAAVVALVLALALG
jgi:hypothetical protein